MSSIRLQVVDAIATALATATGLTVFRNLDQALDQRLMPAVVVRSSEDRVLGQAISLLDQQADLEIIVLFAFGKTPEADCDPYECEIHAALMASPIFGGVTVLMERLGGMWTFDLGDCAARTLNYRFGYRTSVTSLEA